MAIFYKKPLIYLPRSSRNQGTGGKGSGGSDIYLIQTPSIPLSTSQAMQPYEFGKVGRGELYWFSRYNTKHPYPPIHGVPALEYQYDVQETVKYDKFYCLRVGVGKDLNSPYAEPYDYYSLLWNYYWWSGTHYVQSVFGITDGFGTATGEAYVFFGDKQTKLYWQFMRVSSNPLKYSDRVSIQFYGSDFQGTDSWIPIGNPRRNIFSLNYEAFTYDCANQIASRMLSIPAFQNSPYAEIFVIGYPLDIEGASNLTFTESELLTIIRMVCERRYGGYTYEEVIQTKP